MIVKEDIKSSSITWFPKSYPEEVGTISALYQPESRAELIELGKRFYSTGQTFRVIGHCSNIYIEPSFSADNIISTRKLNSWIVSDDYIECDCGVIVSLLAKSMVKEGIKGFDGLTDLPGTLAGSIYGNSSCYGFSINAILLDFDVLLPTGEIKRLTPAMLNATYRMTDFKRGKINGIIVSARLKKDLGDKQTIEKEAERIHKLRIETQPSPAYNLGSMYRNRGRHTVLFHIVKTLAVLCAKVTKNRGNKKEAIRYYFLKILGASDLLPYTGNELNRYYWRDEKAHSVFPIFLRLHKLLYTRSDLEIEIW